MATKIIIIELEVEDQFIPAEDVIEDIVQSIFDKGMMPHKTITDRVVDVKFNRKSLLERKRKS